MTTATFIVRFWRETTESEERWRGRIEHVQSGESIAFLDFDAMLNFMWRFGIIVEGQHQLPQEEV